MSNYKSYKCYRCFFTTPKKHNITIHLNRKFLCKRSELCYYTDKEIEQLNNEQFEKKKKNSINKEIINIKNDINIINDIHDNITNNITNITNNITNNITVKIDKLIPFNEDWDLSNIEKHDKFMLLFSQIMYTRFLEKILENDANNNVIIDSKTNSGLVYTNENNEKKYITMEIDSIVRKSMDKLNKQLNDIYSDIECELLKNYVINDCKKNINEKYENFATKSDIKDIVEKYIIEVYNNNKELSLKMLKIDLNEKSNNYLPI
jgi:hypothetical protein